MSEEKLLAEAEHALLERPRISISLARRSEHVPVLCSARRRCAGLDGHDFARACLTSCVSKRPISSLLELEHARRFEKNYLLYGTNLEEALARVETAQHVLRSARNSLEQLVDQQTLDRMEENLDRYHGLLARFGPRSNGTSGISDRERIERDLRRYGAQVVVEATEIIDRERLQMHVLLRTAWQVALSSLLFVLLMMIALVFILRLQVVGPLRRFVKYTERIANGDYSPIWPARSYRDEYCELALAINRMLLRLRDREEQLIRTSRMAAVGTLTAGIAHELNNPLNNIGLNTEALLNGLASYSDEQKRKMLGDVANQVDRASATVRNLLDFTRVEKPVFVLTSLGEAVQEARRLVANEAQINNVVFDVSLPADLPGIEGNPGHLQQVFLNLFLNAIQAMPQGGSLRVRAHRADDNTLEVEVADTGTGIPQEHLGEIFDPFYTSKEVGEGTGLGLFVTYAIIEQHHGEITVRSEVGQGTAFTIVLPAVASPATTCSKEI